MKSEFCGGFVICDDFKSKICKPFHLFLQSGHFYKVNVPVMVTQAPGCHRMPPQSNQPQMEQRNLPSGGIIHNLPASQVPPPPPCPQSVPAPQALQPLMPQQPQVLQPSQSPLDLPLLQDPEPLVDPQPAESPPGNLDEFTLDGIDFSLQPVDMSTPPCLSAEQMVERAVREVAEARLDSEDTLSQFLPDLERTPGALKVEFANETQGRAF